MAYLEGIEWLLLALVCVVMAADVDEYIAGTARSDRRTSALVKD
jgi:hypothetical protein